MAEIIPLDGTLIHRSNYNSFGGTRGKNSEASYMAYCEDVLSWSIPESKKVQLLKDVHKRYSEILKYEAQHVSVMVAGPANYNARRLDKSEQVLRLSAEFCKWFEKIKEQINNGTMDDVETIENRKISRLLEMIAFCDSKTGFDPTSDLMKLAFADNAKFIELFEQLQSKYKWRKNSNIYKLYLRSKSGEVQEIKKEVVFQDDNFSAYKEGDRYYIKFVLKPKRQLIVALKSRGWWWNARQNAWSTYLNKFNLEWVSGISEQYEKYI
ncbi:hypothetical protein GNQ08_27155 [Paenibacillus macerans]|uniref:Uncharacterized protein n=1 Tax=Paenibacillus macerans TaxID=44252 RepID=A0A6N8F212_PAEMA|nr:hypothetical protein [Paenibacillus macerans]MUG26044.1 hypothetical protein [Paenibacillus macerans]OMG45237.1 hypothetical protein BK140_33385 [Paenibacillus macerans]